MSVNSVHIIGNLGRDPEIRHTQSGKTVATLSVATTYKPKNGEEQTEWHRVTVWDKAAEFCERYLTKGRQVYVQGRLQTRSYEKDGIKRYSTEIVANRVEALGPKLEGGGGRRDDEPEPYDPGDYSPGPADDDIPF